MANEKDLDGPPADDIITGIPDFPSVETEPAESKREMLHNEERVVRGQLLNREQTAERYGWQGALLAILTLPPDPIDKEGSQVGIIDYGDFDPASPPTVAVREGKSWDFLGRAKARYGLVSLNYTPRPIKDVGDYLGVYYPLNPGQTTLGRNNDSPNPELALSEDFRGNTTTTFRHLTITLAPDHTITVRDHSTNGTGFETGE